MPLDLSRLRREKMGEDFTQIPSKQPSWIAGRSVLYDSESGATFKLRDSYNAVSKVPTPSKVQVIKEGASTFKLKLLYKPGLAPRASSSPESQINTHAFDGLSLLVQTGVDTATGKPVGRVFKDLICDGWSWKELDGEKYEQITCSTPLPTEWETVKPTMGNLWETKD
jgi:hypothetical protein